MYRKLLPHLNKFVLLRQGMLGRAYIGRLMDVDQEVVEIQTYHPDGTRAETWTVSLATITEFLTDSRQLDMLALKVKWATSHHLDGAEDEDVIAGVPQEQSERS